MLAGDHTESESVLSDSLSQAANSRMFHSPSPHTETSSHLHGHAASYAGLGYPEITPGDSASVANGDDGRSTVSSHVQGTFSFKFNYGNKTHRFRCEYHNYAALREIVRQKIMAEHLSLSQSYVKVADGEGDDQDAEGSRRDDDSWLNIAYLDDENDEVLMTCDADLADAVQLARKSGQDRVRLFVHDAIAEQQQQQQQQAATASHEEVAASLEVPSGKPTISVIDTSEEQHKSGSSDGEEAEGAKSTKRQRGKRHSHRGSEEAEDGEETSTENSSECDDDEMKGKGRHRRHQKRASRKRDIAAEYNLPIPQEMLLPAAITFLGVVILGVFTITKLTGSSDRRY